MIWNVKEYNDSIGNKLDYGELLNGNGFLTMYSRDGSIPYESGEIINGFKQGVWVRFCGNGVDTCDKILYKNGLSPIQQELKKERVFIVSQVYW
jgi:hypothetical protein